MAYEVTATRRRPRRFEDLVGQDFVVATLQKSIEAGKIAHAYLFSGPRGCGKTSSARILAKALNCETGPGPTPCGICAACTEITRGASLDVIEIDGASNTSVNDVRQIKDEVQFPPNSCRYKVYIIDEVHMLSTSAFNALLKTIEEPPPYVIFIFATTELHKVPATIKSRCQQFNFRLVPVDLLKQVLSEAANEAEIHAEDEALFWIAREATGSVRDAYTLFDQVAAFSGGHITFEKIRDKLGLVGVDRINPVIESCVNRDGLSALTSLDDILQNGVSVEQFVVDVADYFRSLLLIKSGVTKESLLGQSPERFSAKVLDGWAPVQIERALGIMLQLFRDIRYSLEPRYELELAVSRLSWISDYVSSAEMKTAIAQAQQLLQGGSSRPSSPSRGVSGPFPEADPSSGSVIRTAVRESAISQQESNLQEASGYAESFNKNQVLSVSPSPVVSTPADQDERIENPFAAFKERMNGGMKTPISVPEASSSGEGASLSDADVFAAEAVQESNTDEESADEADAKTSELPVSGISFNQLPASLISLFQNTKSMVATSLSQAFDWKDLGNTVQFSVDKPFIHNFLEQEHKTIAESVSSLLGRQTGIEIHLDSSRTVSEEMQPGTAPPQVEILRQMFRGTIVGEE